MTNQKIMNEFADLLEENRKLKERVRELDRFTLELQSLLSTADLNIPKIKADAIREAIAECRDAAQMYDRSGVIAFCTVADLEEHSDKIERGE